MIPFHYQSQLAPHHVARAITLPTGLGKAELFAFLQREVPLPDYFGHNWDALEECLADLGWLKDRKILLIHEDIPLANAPADQKIYLQVLAAAAGESARLIVIFPEIFRSDIKRILSDSA